MIKGYLLMIEKIVFINDNSARLKVKFDTAMSKDLINLHLVFDDGEKKILGEIVEVNEDIIDVQFLGEFIAGRFIPGTIKKPKLQANVRAIGKDELDIIMSTNNPNTFIFGGSVLYNNYPLRVSVDDLFSNHMAIFGNTGSGKSYGVSKLLQSVFYDPNNIALNSTFMVFDVHGEYRNAFSKISEKNANYICKEYSADEQKEGTKLIQIPLWLLDIVDIGFLLKATEYAQLAIIEKSLYTLSILTAKDEFSVKYKNHIIAKAIQSIMYSSLDAAKARSDIFEILSICSTEELNLNIEIHGIGYVRQFKKCFEISREGMFAEDILIAEYIEKFINDDLENKVSKKIGKCNLEDLEEALNFVVVSESMLNNHKMYNSAMMLKMKLHSLIVGGYGKYFDYPEIITLDAYLYKLLTNETGRKAQIIGFDMDGFETGFASFVAKTISKLLLEYTMKLKVRGSLPINILLEEAHRFVMVEPDSIFGDDVFDKIAREGRKYGMILTLVSQRPTELSEVILSQCSSFLLFRINHPRDLEYMKKAIPNINSNIIEKQRSIQPGYFVGIGKAFTIPMIIKLDEPNPAPASCNSRVFEIWSGKKI